MAAANFASICTMARRPGAWRNTSEKTVSECDSSERDVYVW